MNYSPKLRKAMEEIKDVLKKHDIAGFIAIHTPGHVEYSHNLMPSYSACNIDNTTGIVVIKGKLEHYLGDKKEQQYKLNATCNMLRMLAEATMEQGLNIGNLSEKADEIYGTEHGNTTHYGKTELDN